MQGLRAGFSGILPTGMKTCIIILLVVTNNTYV